MMKSNLVRHYGFAAVITAALLMCSVCAAFAAETDINMTEGEVRGGFDAAGTSYESADPSVAWVDQDGNLNAMKEGSTTISAAGKDGSVTTYNVTVSDYTDGSEVVGRLKLLARFNDSMKFYDGHAYLLFTSYKDGVEINVDDLYGGYEISDQYYTDIRKDISSGSNHTGTDADKYFWFDKDMKSVTLDRGGIVTIGMYRGFDLSVRDAVLGMLQDSTLWGKLAKAGKTAVIKSLFQLVNNDQITEDELIAALIAIFQETGINYQGWLNGVVRGGVCFNRELYNQKLEWDQYENVTYELDITEDQLETLVAYLGGNLDKFNIASNSCATVALRAWNASVGTRNGEKSSYWLSDKGNGVYSIVDAPKGVKDAIMSRLPGYYLNNADGVEEPDAGFQDETGWVYVSAPEPLPESIPYPDEPAGSVNTLKTRIVKDDGLAAEAEVYYYSGTEKKVLGDTEEVASGTKVYVKPAIASDDEDSVLTGIAVNGNDIMSGGFDSSEKAYSFVMPARAARLRIVFEAGYASAKSENIIQAFVGDTLDATEYVDLYLGADARDSSSVRWYELTEDSQSMLELSADGRTLKAVKAGRAYVYAGSDCNENIGVIFQIDVYQSRSGKAAVTFDAYSDDYSLLANIDGEWTGIPFSGYMVDRGTELKVEAINETPKAISGITVNGQPVAFGDTIKADEDTEIDVAFTNAFVRGVPNTIRLAAKGDTYKLSAKVRYSSLDPRVKVYDDSVTFASSDPLVTVDENGLITVAGDVPEGGKSVTVTAYAGSSNNMVDAECKVVVGDYKGADIVGKLTIWARSFTRNEAIPHGGIVFQTYDDLDMAVSCYNYYEPKYMFRALMEDYAEHPEKYKSDPALYDDNTLGIKDRESYFNVKTNGAYSAPEVISMKAGESISLSNYDHGNSNLETLLLALEGGEAADSESTQKLIAEIRKYLNGEEIDGEAAFDSALDTLIDLFISARFLGENPANGVSEGGLDVNHEIYNIFIRNDAKMLSACYEVEITRDELAELQKYLADPENNYYSLFTKNCGAGVVDIWNATLADQPKLQVTANLTGLAVEPESLYLEILQMPARVGAPGKSGFSFYPRTVANVHGQYLPEDEQTKAQRNKKLKSGLKVKKSGKGKKAKVTVKWKNLLTASRYKVLAAYKGKGKLKAVKTVKNTGSITINSSGQLVIKTGGKTTFKKLGGKKLKAGKKIRVRVVAYDKNGKKIAQTGIKTTRK